ELTEDLRSRVVCGEVEDVDVSEGAECPQYGHWVAGVLLQLRARAHAEEHRAAIGDKPPNIVVVVEGAVSALPRLVPLPPLRSRLGRRNLARFVVAGSARQRPDLDVLHPFVAELLVQGERARVLDDHL